MDYRILNTVCGCISSNDVDMPISPLLLKDSDVLPLPGKVLFIAFDDVAYGVDKPFVTKELILSYLNTTFVSLISLNGFFLIVDYQIAYSNPEKFKTAEIMAIASTRLLVYKFGTGGQTPIIPYTDTLANRSAIPGTHLTKNILSIRKDEEIPIQLSLDNLSQDPINNGLTFVHDYDDCNIWITVADEIPDEATEGFPYILPFNL